MAVDDARVVVARGQGAEGLAPVAGEAGGDEGVGDGLVAVADQERALQGERHPLDDPPGADLERADVAGGLLTQRRGERRQPGLAGGAASDSTARSASTFCISGCSASTVPKTERCESWWIAPTTPARIPEAPPRTQSSRVWLTISMIVRTPAPSSPTSQAEAASNSTSLEAFDLLPSLS